MLELFTVDIDGTNEHKVNGPLGGYRVLSAHSFWSPDGSKIAYAADQDTKDTIELYTANPDGTGGVKISGTMGATQDVRFNTALSFVPKAAFLWSPDSTRIAYVSDQETDTVYELFVAPADGSSAPQKVSGTMVSGGGMERGNADALFSFAWSGNGKCLSYFAEETTSGETDLYAVALDQISDCPAVQGLPQLFTIGGPLRVPVATAVTEAAWSAGRIVSNAAGAKEVNVSDASGTTQHTAPGNPTNIEGRRFAFDRTVFGNFVTAFELILDNATGASDYFQW